MQEHGFYHPSIGYWQTNDTPPQDILDGYPEGTEEIPLKPSPDHQWLNGIWVYVEPEPEVPFDVSKLQLVRAMRDRPYQQGTMWDAFKFMLSQDPVAQEDWDLANRIERDHPMTPQIGLIFDLDESELDDLFIDANTR